MDSTIITGSPKEVADKIARLHYDTVEAIVLPGVKKNGAPAKPGLGPNEDIFAEMTAFTANAPNADDSREAIYTRKPGE